MQEKLTVCILSLNRSKKVLTNLGKIFRSRNYKEGNLEVILIDNNSCDDTVLRVEEKFGEAVEIIQTGENIGITGWNRGVNVAQGQYVLLLDDDAYITDQNIDAAIKLFEDNPEVGIYAMRVISPFDGLDFNKEYPTGLLSFWGCGVFLRKRMVDEIGSYDEDFFFQAFELDYSIRAKNAGWKIFYDHHNPLYHMTTIMRNQTDFKFYYSRRNLIINAIRHFSIRGNFSILPDLISLTVGAKKNHKNRVIIRSIVDGLWVGFKKRSVVKPEIEKLYLDNFIEFQKSKIQLTAWNDKSFWRNRSEYYPDFDPEHAGTQNVLQPSKAIVREEKYEGYDWPAIDIGKLHFCIHKPPQNLDPLVVEFNDVTIERKQKISFIASLLDDRADDVFLCLDLKKGAQVVHKFRELISPEDNCKHVSLCLGENNIKDATLHIYSESVNENDKFEYAKISIYGLSVC